MLISPAPKPVSARTKNARKIITAGAITGKSKEAIPVVSILRCRDTGSAEQVIFYQQLFKNGRLNRFYQMMVEAGFARFDLVLGLAPPG